MKLYFKQIRKCGYNRYLSIDTDKKEYDLMANFYKDYVSVSYKDYKTIKESLIASGYKEVYTIY